MFGRRIVGGPEQHGPYATGRDAPARQQIGAGRHGEQQGQYAHPDARCPECAARAVPSTGGPLGQGVGGGHRSAFRRTGAGRAVPGRAAGTSGAAAAFRPRFRAGRLPRFSSATPAGTPTRAVHAPTGVSTGASASRALLVGAEHDDRTAHGGPDEPPRRAAVRAQAAGQVRGEEADPGHRAADGDDGRDEDDDDAQGGHPGPFHPYAEGAGVVVAESQDAEHRHAQHQRRDGRGQPGQQSGDVVPGAGGQTSQQIAVDELEVELVGHHHEHQQGRLERGGDGGPGQQHRRGAPAESGGDQGEQSAERGSAQREERLQSERDGQGQNERCGDAQRGARRDPQHLGHRQRVAERLLEDEPRRAQAGGRPVPAPCAEAGVR